jgi:hypothetical protein
MGFAAEPTYGVCRRANLWGLPPSLRAPAKPQSVCSVGPTYGVCRPAFVRKQNPRAFAAWAQPMGFAAQPSCASKTPERLQRGPNLWGLPPQPSCASKTPERLQPSRI